jgi:phosphoribosyl 1,2-cyclic phosphodiesterase
VRFASLGSGSRGNATLIAHGTTYLLVDCGFSVRETEKRLARLNVSATQLTAIVVTHEHQDHSQGVAALARKFRLPVYMTAGAQQGYAWGELPEQQTIEPECDFSIDAIQCHPFTVPHDAAEPVQFVFSDGAHRIGLLTDTGKITAHIVESLSQLDALLLECNHDLALLQQSDYPATLKARVGGDYGHLNNTQAAQLLERIDCSELQHVIAMHLSQHNNTPRLAQQALAAVMNCAAADIPTADQLTGLDWRSV